MNSSGVEQAKNLIWFKEWNKVLEWEILHLQNGLLVAC